MGHLKIKHNIKPEDFPKCDLCTKKFLLESDLEDHIPRCSKNPNRHECPKCHKRFQSYQGYDNHTKKENCFRKRRSYKTKDGMKKIKKFKCNTCGKRLVSYQALKNHKSKGWIDFTPCDKNVKVLNFQNSNKIILFILICH